MQSRPILSSSIILCVLALATLPVTAASPAKTKPSAASKYVGLQYDEIARMVITPATPPPPGTFGDAYQKILADAPAVGTAPTPPPRRGGLFGGLLGSIENAGQEAQQAASQMQLSFNDGTLTRLAYYNGWVRTDNVVAQTATIDKCVQHQLIELDLAHKTYKIVNTENNNPACATPTPAPYSGGRVDESPGTEDLTISSTTVNLGPKTLQGIPTRGSTDTTQMATTKATGSCSNGSFGVENERYVSNITIPRRICPLAKARVPSTPVDMVARGGCKPNIIGSLNGAYWMRASDRLEMYSRMSMTSGESAGGFQSVTQRGNVAWLTKAQADALFSVPPGFTLAQ